MRLHWFREHKNVVYYLLIPGVVIGLVFFVPTGGGGHGLGGPAPSILYTVGNRSFELSPSEVLQLRNAYNGANPSGFYDSSASQQQNENNATTWNIGTLAAEDETAREQGYEVGHESFKDALRNVVKRKIQQIDRMDAPPDLTPVMYDKMLAQLNLSRNQYEAMIHDLLLRESFRMNVQANVNEPDPAQYLAFIKRKENVRIRYKTVKSEDFFAKTKEPTAEEIEKVFNMPAEADYPNPSKKMYNDIFMTEATLALEAFFYKDEKPFAGELAKVTDRELQNYYELYKNDKWKDPNKKTEPKGGFFARLATGAQHAWLPFESVKADVEKQWKESELKRYYDLHKRNWPAPDPAKKDTFKPFESVKAEVEKLWQEDRVSSEKFSAKNTVMLKVNALLKNDLPADIAKFKALPENDKKTFDIDAWAKDHQLVRWVTPEYPVEKYRENKADSITMSLGEQIFGYAEPASMRQHMDEFTSLTWLNQDKPELGGIVARKLNFTDSRERTLEEARPKIIERLKTIESAKLASDEANRLHDKWAKGEDLPNLDELDEFTSEKKPNHPLVARMKENPKPVGEVLDVAKGQHEPDEKEKERNKNKPFNSTDYERAWYHVGVIVERKLPTMDGYVHAPTTEWNRIQEQGNARHRNGMAVMFAMLEQIHTNVTRIGTMADPDLRQVFQRGDQ